MATVDNKIWNKNIESISKRYPNILKKLNKQAKENLKIKIIDSKDGHKTMTINNNEYSMYINSKYRPIDEAQKWVDSLNIKDNSIVTIFGIGMGYRIKQLLKKLTNNNGLIIVEPHISIFREVLKNIDFTDVIEKENVYLCINEKEQELKDILWKNSNWRNVNNSIYSSIPNYNKLFKEEYNNYYNIAKDIIIVDKMGYNTIKKFSDMWQKNIFQNAHHILKSLNVKDFFLKFQNKPAVVVSAGPSLNKNVKLLKQVKEKAVIICVGTALKVLLKENIKPDFVITIDGGSPNYRHFKGIDYSDIPIIYLPSTYPRILEEHKGNKIIFLSEDIYLTDTFNKYISNIGFLKIGGTVALSAMDFAVKIGANPVMFIGQDLAFTDGKTHAGGTVYGNHIVDKKNNKSYMMVESVDGKEVLTNSTWYAFLKLIEKEIETDNSNRIYIDATEGGAKINSTKIMAFKEAIQEYCINSIEVTDKINKIIKNNKPVTEEQIVQITKELKEIENEFGKIKKKCREGKNLSLELLSIYKNNKYYNLKSINSILKKLNDIDNCIKSKKENFLPLKYSIDFVMLEFMNGMGNEKAEDIKESEIDNGIRISKRSLMLYEKINNCINILQPYLHKCIESIESM